jgi:cytochrome c553
VVAVAIAISGISAAQAGDPKAATEKAETVCAGCHGPDGISTNPLWPNIAGQKEQYLIKALKEYRDSTRAEPSMSAMAQALSDREIDNLAAYYAALPDGS